MILNALVERLQRRSKHDFKGRHYEAMLILQAVSWSLRYPLSYRDIEELFLERGLEVDHSTLNRWVLAYAPLIEKRLRAFRKPHCGSIRIDETYVKVRGQWRYLYGPSTNTETRSISSSRPSAIWRPPSASSARR
jgi:transposase, IS6 family